VVRGERCTQAKWRGFDEFLEKTRIAGI